MSEKNKISRRSFLATSAAAIAGAASLTGKANAADSNSPKSVSPLADPNWGGVKDTDIKIRVAACQILTYPDIEKSTNKVIDWIKTAAKDKIDVVSFPEGTLCGCQAEKSFYDKVGQAAFVNAENKIINAVKDLNIAVILGTVQWEGDKLFNSLLIIDKGGIVRGRYAKIKNAENWTTPGSTMPVYTVAGVKSCFIICADIRWPELVRLPVVKGAQICYFCAHESQLTFEHKMSAHRAMPISRAAENRIFVVMANCPADPNNVKGNCSHGNSKIIEPHGNIIDEARHFEERLVAANIDLKDSNRMIAKMIVAENTVLKPWINEGTKMVTVSQ